MERITLQDCVMKTGFIDSVPDFPEQEVPTGYPRALLHKPVVTHLWIRSGKNLNFFTQVEVNGTVGH